MLSSRQSKQKILDRWLMREKAEGEKDGNKWKKLPFGGNLPLRQLKHATHQK